MRQAFIDGLTDIAVRDSRVMLLSADLGYKLFDDFSARCPDRFLNMGVSEANMVSVAAGLAAAGKRPFTYSIAPFATVRCLEQVRNDICSMEQPVTVVGIGGGYAYGPNGPTHHGIDDIAVMRAMPGMTVVCPCDPRETIQAIRSLVDLGQPAYLRLGRAGETVLPQTDGEFALGRPTVLREGEGVALLACGQVAEEALKAAALLEEEGIDALVASVHTVKPLGGLVDWLLERPEIDRIVVVEEHGPCGGLFEALAARLVRLPRHPQLASVAAPDRFIHAVGSQDFIREQVGLGARSICRTVLDNRLEVA